MRTCGHSVRRLRGVPSKACELVASRLVSVGRRGHCSRGHRHSLLCAVRAAVSSPVLSPALSLSCARCVPLTLHRSGLRQRVWPKARPRGQAVAPRLCILAPLLPGSGMLSALSPLCRSHRTVLVTPLHHCGLRSTRTLDWQRANHTTTTTNKHARTTETVTDRVSLTRGTSYMKRGRAGQRGQAAPNPSRDCDMRP